MPLAIEGEGEGERHWHYPTNLPVRDYQLAIAETCLRHNTLVVLPTGLGKTLIASVVLFNFGRWFPGGKLVFVAPTRPLVAQQLAATQQLCASAELVELTGAQIPSERERLWGAKRLFFTTPHVLQNDLVTGSCPGGAIRLLVFDEAHRATGRHAYCEVMRRLAGSAASMRVVGLTATPAATVGGIQQLVEVLRVSRVEYRSEESPDVAPHAHRRDVRQVVVQPSEALIRVQECFERTLLGKYYSDLRRHDAIAEMPLAELQGFRLLQERDACRARLHGSPVLGVLEGSFAMLMSLATAGEILALHGIVPFVGRLQGGEEGPLRTRLRHELEAHPELLRMVKELSNEPGFVSHPKITWVERLLLGHFEDSAPDTRAVVFAADRESVKEVVARLARHAPRIRAMAFTGQTAATLASKAFAQRQQLEVWSWYAQASLIM
jgi:ERCC4-related helicase